MPNDVAVEMDAQVQQLVMFTLDERRIALPLRAVERVVAIARITPLPKAPAVVLGILNVHGAVIPVLDIRERFGLPAREAQLTDRLLIAHTTRRRVALVADGVGGVVSTRQSLITTAERIFPGVEHLKGVAVLDDDLIVIHDLESFLMPAEESVLAQALSSN
jgi:purine-binding chemotaxis protein CheW